jgi:hypothetical protein
LPICGFISIYDIPSYESTAVSSSEFTFMMNVLSSPIPIPSNHTCAKLF